MILKLSIKNYILIEKLDVNFKEGFSSITGETGAGKSIILGALNLISGARVDHQIVGPKNEKCIVEGEFLISESLVDFFNFHDLDFDDHTILRREILVNGKSRAFINDSPVKLDIIKSLSEKLINVHSQNHSHILSNNNIYYELLDSYADQVNITNDYKKYFSDYTKIKKEIDFINDKKIEFLKNIEYNRFIYNEIDQLELDEGEEILLVEKFNSLKNDLGNLGENKLLLITAVKVMDEYHETKKKVEQKKIELKELSNKFRELKSLVYEYRDRKEEEIKNLNKNHLKLKDEIEQSQKHYEKLIDTAADEISNFVEKANLENLS